jgi:hypothetical protein
MLRFSQFAFFCGLLSLATVLQADGQQQVRFRLDAGPGAHGIAARLRLARDGALPLVAALVVTSDNDSTAALGPGEWQVTVESEQWWAPPATVTVAAGGPKDDAVHLIRVWPAATLRGEVALSDPHEKRPDLLSVRIDEPPAYPLRAGIPAGAMVDCPVKADNTWSCRVPATLADISIRSKGFIPHYRWGLRMKAGDRIFVGRILLKRGASVAGRLRVEGGAIRDNAAWVRILRYTGPGASSSAAERLSRPLAQTTVAKDGHFQLAGIPPGTYAVEAGQPNAAIARVFPIEIERESETVLKSAIVLRPPLTLTLTLDPPLDWHDEPWRVTVYRRSDYNGSTNDPPVNDAPAKGGGRVIIPDQSPGSYDVTVADSEGNPFWDREIVVTGDSDATRSISLDLLKVHGRVTLADDPLSAALLFGGRYGALHARIQSDGDGHFTGFLPKGGAWDVEVQASSPQLVAHADVTVLPDAHGEAEIAITLPSNRLEGRVLDESGAPVAKGRVTLVAAKSSFSVLTDASGSFTFRAMPVGSVSLSAEGNVAGRSARHSREFLLTVDETSIYGPIELHLEANRRLAGRVTSTRGPVAGAGVDVMTFGAEQRQVSAATTDLEGRFETVIPDAATRAFAVLSPPGFALAGYDLPLDGTPLDLPAVDLGGRLEVTVPATFAARRLILVVLQNDRMLPLSDLLRWSLGHGVALSDKSDLLEVPDVAPGAYKACLVQPAVVPESQLFLLIDRSPCAGGVLAPGGLLRVDLSKF